MISITLPDGRYVQVGQIINFNTEGKQMKGKIIKFTIADKGGWNSPWAGLQDISSKDKTEYWISLNNWCEEFPAPKAFVSTMPVGEDVDLSLFI